jgi:hypothetical protein
MPIMGTFDAYHDASSVTRCLYCVVLQLEIVC